ncbi:hypothetical protein HanIR_Chr16g0804901 [Helianthus annuus]|nr:hypothetical protein HanIR_Chr16g0804901 [Helianthus annuus]
MVILEHCTVECILKLDNSFCICNYESLPSKTTTNMGDNEGSFEENVLEIEGKGLCYGLVGFITRVKKYTHSSSFDHHNQYPSPFHRHCTSSHTLPWFLYPSSHDMTSKSLNPNASLYITHHFLNSNSLRSNDC